MFQDSLKPFLDHLEDLRKTVILGFIFLACRVGIAAPFAPGILAILTRPLEKAGLQPLAILQSWQVLGAFNVALQTAFWSGLLLSLPFLFALLVRFVYPGLTQRERAMSTAALFMGTGLFAGGVALGYFIVLPVGLRLMSALHAWMGITPNWFVTSYVTFSLQVMLAFGIAFELPVVVMILGYTGIIRAHALRKYRRHSIVGILAGAMILTPGGDVFSQMAMAVPMIVLYEVCIIVTAVFERKRNHRAGSSLPTGD